MLCVRRILLGVFVCHLLIVSVVAARELPTAAPNEVGMCPGRLGRIDSYIQKAIAEERTAGVVTMVSRRGQVVHLKAFGMMNRESKKVMRPDTMFRIASMTKPVTSVAVMLLYEEGKLLLDDPVSNYIPEFRKPKVLVLEPSENGEPARRRIVPAKREITVRHLLTHTSGLTYQWNEHLGQAYKDADITHGLLQDEGTLSQKMKRLATLPLLHQPGDAYEYGLSIDVLGYLVEVVSGKTLDEFFRARIFDPLGMNDTHFFPPEGKQDRLAAVYQRTEEGRLKRASDDPIVDGAFVYSVDYPYDGPRRYYSGGGGLCSTAPDYMRFCQMLLDGGELDGVRILSRKTVELMTTNQIGDLDAWQEQKFGLGFFILTHPGRTNLNATPGSYGWGGFFTTRFLIDPTEQLIVISMTQLLPDHNLPINDVVPILATQAIVD